MPTLDPDDCVLIMAPLGQDAKAMAKVIEDRGFHARVCNGDIDTCRQLAHHAGALLITEEALALPKTPELLEELKAQPAWSELPVIILTSSGESRSAKLLDTAATAAGTITLLERPISAPTLLRSVEVALQSRHRQYQVRDLLEKQASDQRQLRESEDRYRAFIANSSEGIWRMEFNPPIDTLLPVEEQVELAYRNGRMVECNDAMAHMYALSKAEDLVGKGIDFMLPASDPNAREFVASIIRAGYRATDVESKERDAAGNPVYFSNSMTGVVENGRLRRMWGTQRDISKRKRAEEALRESELRYRTLFDSVDEGFCIIDMIFDESGRAVDYRFVEVNSAFEHHTGLVNAAGKRIRELVPDQDLHWFEIYGRIALTGESVRFENKVSRLNRWFDVYAFRFGLPSDRRVAVLFRDITERRYADEAKARLAAIVEFSEGAILSKDLNGVITSWNRGAERLLGYTAVEAVGQPITLIVPPEHLAEEAGILERIRKRLPTEHFETVRCRKDRRLIDISLTVSPISDASGNIIGASSIAHDITERKQAEQALAKRATEQVALYQFTDRMHRADSVDEVYNSALDAITDALKCERTSILLFDDSGVMRFVAWKGLSDAYRNAVEGHSPWKAGEREAQPVCINDIDTAEISASLKEVVKREGIVALAFIPIMTSGWVIGKFMAYHCKPHNFAQDELDLALNVARQLGVAIERKRAEEALLRSEKRVRQEFLELDAIYRTAPLGFAVFDTQLRFRRINQLLAEMNGVPIEEHIGKTLREVVPSISDQAEHVLNEVLKKRAPVRFEFRGETRAQPGVQRVWDEHWYPLIDQNSQVAGVGVVVEEITERHRAEAALRESENRYRTLVKQVKEYAIFRMNTAGVPTSWNEGVQRVFGFAEAEFVGQDITRIIFTPEDVAAGVPEKELQTAQATGTANNDRWLRRKDGTRFFASGTTSGLRNDTGEHIGFTKVVRDNTTAKEAEDALAEAQAKLQEYATNLEQIVTERTRDLRTTNEQLEAFVYSIAHDLRTPLRALTGYSQLLQSGRAGSLEAPARNLLNRIQASSEFMDKLLLDLLAYGRAASSEVELGQVEVRKAWESACFQCAVQIKEAEAKIDTREPLPTVRAHEGTLGQCLANLLSNALKFVPPDRKPEVRFRAEDFGRYVRLWVEDNGMGIPREHRERIFRVFERLHGSRYVGTGIGLSIVRKGIERMGGHLGLESEPGKGSRFWIELPKAEGK